MPLPDFVTVPAPVLIAPARLLPAAAPSSVNPKVSPVIAPVLERTIAPLLATMVLGLPSVIRPL